MFYAKVSLVYVENRAVIGRALNYKPHFNIKDVVMYFTDLGLYLTLWRIDPLLDNGSVNTFPRKRKRATIVRPLLGNGSVTIYYQKLRVYKKAYSVFALNSVSCYETKSSPEN
jgi:hypothetical protein